MINDNAIRRKYTEINRNSENNKWIPSCEQKRIEVPREFSRKYGIQKQQTKMNILVTESTDVTPLLGKDCTKRYKLTTESKQLAENSQSGREIIINNCHDLFENNGTIKSYELNIQLNPGHYPEKQ